MQHRQFDYLALRLTFQARQLLKLPPAPGSMLRGAFGTSLKQMFCRNPRGCRTYCEAGAQCTYGRMFETPLDRPHTLLGDVRFAPHPFALHVVTTGPAILEPGQELVVDWTVWGEALKDAMYALLAWREAGERGFGVTRSACTLALVTRRDTGAIVYDPATNFVGNLTPAAFRTRETGAARVTLRTASPLRIKHDRRLFGKGATGPVQMPSDVLFLTIERRIATCIGNGQPPLHDARENGWPEASSSRFVWQENSRYSNRQKTTMQIGGVVGEMHWERLEGAWLQLLRLGEILQVGKNTSMGLGKYHLIVEEL